MPSSSPSSFLALLSPVSQHPPLQHPPLQYHPPFQHHGSRACGIVRPTTFHPLGRRWDGPGEDLHEGARLEKVNFFFRNSYISLTQAGSSGKGSSDMSKDGRLSTQFSSFHPRSAKGSSRGRWGDCSVVVNSLL